jgi:putative salt-induced outer membrane protein
MLIALLLTTAAPVATPDAPAGSEAIDPASIPAPIRTMLDAAMAAGDDAAVATIVKYARAADPLSGDAVLQIASEWRTVRARARDDRLREATAFELWTGRIEAGGSVSTGNSDITGLAIVADFSREGLNWRHKLHLQADYQRTSGVTSREHYITSYEPNFKIDDRTYIYGSAQFESDRFLGYTSRYSTSVGAGYSVIRNQAMKLDLELGPAYRITAFTDDRQENNLAARGNLDFDWTLSPGLKVTQKASIYLQQANSTISGTSALSARLIGPLSAQISYAVQYESVPPAGRVSTDTTGRASLVYTF